MAMMDRNDSVNGGTPFPVIIVVSVAAQVTANMMSFRDLNNTIEDSKNPFFSIVIPPSIDRYQYFVY
jgi:hypothetical protein